MEGKHMWETWYIDYIGPFRKSESKQYVLVGGEVVSGLLQAESFPWATGENTVKALMKYFSILPKSNSIQSDNGSHFMQQYKNGPDWSTRLSDAVKRVSNHWGINGCHWVNAFCPKASSLVPITADADTDKVVGHNYSAGHPVLA